MDAPIEWAISTDYVPYQAAVDAMEARVAAIRAGAANEIVWLLEHPSVYTGGTSANAEDLRNPQFPVLKTARGGQYTYHGPGQRVAYAMIDLNRRRRDIRAFIATLEEWIISTLHTFNVEAERHGDRVGVWVNRTQPSGPTREDKIAAIGVRLRHWITFHGISLNVEPDLAHFDGIVPCGISDDGLGVTSIVDLGLPVTMDDIDVALRASFETFFGPTTPVAPII